MTTAPLHLPTANQLLALEGITPADNPFGFSTALHWKSDLSAIWLQGLHRWRQLLKEVDHSPWACLKPGADLLGQGIDTALLDPIREQARQSVAKNLQPDPFRRQNNQIEHRYAAILEALCGQCLDRGRFSRAQVIATFGGGDGQLQLYRSLLELSLLEHSYHSHGLTRLTALKELLKALLMVITETPVIGLHPYRRYGADGKPEEAFDGYLANLRRRFECLHANHAFDLVRFSETCPQATLGACRYDVVEGSRIHGVTLRRYRPLPQTPPQPRAIYLSSPLINQADIFDLAPGKSVVEGLRARGYRVYLVDYGNAGAGEARLGLEFYGKQVHDRYLELIHREQPDASLAVMGYCMGGTLILPYLARRAEERRARGLAMDIHKVALMATPVRFDDERSGHRAMRDLIRTWYDPELMATLFGDCNVPPQVIESGMNQIQPGVRYTVTRGFFERATSEAAVREAAPFLNWLFHGTRFPARAHRQWIERVFVDNQIWKGSYRLPSTLPALDGEPVDMNALAEMKVCIMDYRGERDPISPLGSCIASETWGCDGGRSPATTSRGLNRTIEKNIGHIFVVSSKHLEDYLERVCEFYAETPSNDAGDSQG